jgi:hypothetical protein
MKGGGFVQFSSYVGRKQIVSSQYILSVWFAGGTFPQTSEAFSSSASSFAA